MAFEVSKIVEHKNIKVANALFHVSMYRLGIGFSAVRVEGSIVSEWGSRLLSDDASTLPR